MYCMYYLLTDYYFSILLWKRLFYLLLLSQHLNSHLMELLEHEFWSFFFTQDLIWWEENTQIAINYSLISYFLSLIIGLKGLQVNIRSIDEAIVIGAALSLSSSAFVLQVFLFIHNFICCWLYVYNMLT